MRLLMSLFEMVEFALLDVLCHVSMGYMIVILFSARDIRKKDEVNKR